MEKQTKKGNNYASNPFYQAGSSIENKFLDDVLEDKVKSLQETITQLETQIDKRKEIRDYNMQRILLDSCYTGTELLNLPLRHFDPIISKQRSSLEQQLARLEKEKRDEDTSLWKDIQMLYKDLSEAKKEHQSMVGKVHSLVPKKLYSAFGLSKKEKTETKEPENDPEFDEIVKSSLTRMP